MAGKNTTLRSGPSEGDDGGDIRQQVSDTFELDDLDEGGSVDDNDEPDAGDDAPGDTDEIDPKEDEGLLNDIEQFMKDSERVEPKKKDAKGKQEPKKQEQQERPGRYSQDQKGNIIDPKTGQVLAKAGAEARLYMEKRTALISAQQAGMQAETVRGHLQTAVGFIQRFQSELKGLREANAHATKLGVSPSEQVQALEFVSRLKKGGADGLQAIKEILTRAAAAGMDVQALGVGTGGIDVKAIIDQMRQEFAPIKQNIEDQQTGQQQQREVEAGQRQAYQRAAETTLDFFRNNQDAIPYAKVIEAGLRDPRYRGWTLREVWQRIQLHLAKTGDGRSNESSHRELPRGRRSMGGGNRMNEPAPPSMRFEDLVNEVLDEAGIT